MIRALLLAFALIGLAAPAMAADPVKPNKASKLRRAKPKPIKRIKRGKKKPVERAGKDRPRKGAKKADKARMARSVEVLGFEIGPVGKLRDLKIKTVGDLMRADAKRLIPVFGAKRTKEMKALAQDYAKGMGSSAKGKETKKRGSSGRSDRRGGERTRKAPKLRK